MKQTENQVDGSTVHRVRIEPKSFEERFTLFFIQALIWLGIILLLVFSFTAIAIIITVLLGIFYGFKGGKHILRKRRELNLIIKADAIENELSSQYNAALNSLLHAPETSQSDLQENYNLLTNDQIRSAATDAFEHFIETKNHDNAGKLLDYYDVDPYNVLPVSKALSNYETDQTISLKPQTYKIVLEDNETAFEKLPCNWQKIHTYLAPLEDEIEQADILDSGNIYITDQRVFFVGKKGSETVYLQDIAYMDHKDDALQFFRDEGLSEIFAFPTPHHAEYARLVIEALIES